MNTQEQINAFEEMLGREEKKIYPERKIGETFEYKVSKYIVRRCHKPMSCEECAFVFPGSYCKCPDAIGLVAGKCAAAERTDGEYVVFKKIED